MTPLAEYLVGADRWVDGSFFKAGLDRCYIGLAADYKDDMVVNPVVEDDNPVLRHPLGSVYNITDEDGLVGAAVVCTAKCHASLECNAAVATWLRLSSRKSGVFDMPAAEAMADKTWQSEDTGVIKLFWRGAGTVVAHVRNARKNQITRIIREL